MCSLQLTGMTFSNKQNSSRNRITFLQINDRMTSIWERSITISKSYSQGYHLRHYWNNLTLPTFIKSSTCISLAQPPRPNTSGMFLKLKRNEFISSQQSMRRRHIINIILLANIVTTSNIIGSIIRNILRSIIIINNTLLRNFTSSSKASSSSCLSQ